MEESETCQSYWVLWLRIIVEIVLGLLLRMAVRLLKVVKMLLFGLIRLGKFGKLRGCFNGPSGLCLHDLDHIHITYLLSLFDT